MLSFAMPFLLPALESIINNYIALDPGIFPEWASVDGSVIKIIIQSGPTHTDIGIIINSSGLALYPRLEREPHVTIKGSWKALCAVAYSKGDTRVMFKHPVEITGDIELCQRLQKISHHLNIDWEEQLAERLGDTAARRITRFFKKTKQSVEQSGAQLQRQLQDFLQYEAQVAPQPQEVNALMDAISELRDATERAEARVNRLKAVVHGTLD